VLPPLEPDAFQAALNERGILLNGNGGRTFRAVTHVGITWEDIERVLSCIQTALRTQEHHADSSEVLPFDEVEKRAILEAIGKCNGDISKAARKLGLSRATLYRKLDKYGVR
jgi:transcriptional regulator of acetoin/glycerol metabolism